MTLTTALGLTGLSESWLLLVLREQLSRARRPAGRMRGPTSGLSRAALFVAFPVCSDTSSLCGCIQSAQSGVLTAWACGSHVPSWLQDPTGLRPP